MTNHYRYVKLTWEVFRNENFWQNLLNWNIVENEIYCIKKVMCLMYFKSQPSLKFNESQYSTKWHLLHHQNHDISWYFRQQQKWVQLLHNLKLEWCLREGFTDTEWMIYDNNEYLVPWTFFMFIKQNTSAYQEFGRSGKKLTSK
jgi:hypothetical protein